jgi:hypothetical protein
MCTAGSSTAPKHGPERSARGAGDGSTACIPAPASIVGVWSTVQVSNRVDCPPALDLRKAFRLSIWWLFSESGRLVRSQFSLSGGLLRSVPGSELVWSVTATGGRTWRATLPPTRIVNSWPSARSNPIGPAGRRFLPGDAVPVSLSRRTLRFHAMDAAGVAGSPGTAVRGGRVRRARRAHGSDRAGVGAGGMFRFASAVLVDQLRQHGVALPIEVVRSPQAVLNRQQRYAGIRNRVAGAESSKPRGRTPGCPWDSTPATLSILPCLLD